MSGIIPVPHTTQKLINQQICEACGCEIRVAGLCEICAANEPEPSDEFLDIVADDDELVEFSSADGSYRCKCDMPILVCRALAAERCHQ